MTKAQEQVIEVPAEATTASYYRYIETVNSDSNGNFVSALEQFISTHTEFSLPYIDLFDQLLYLDGRDAAFNYFDSLSLIQPDVAPVFWVLAKLYMEEGEVLKAEEAFVKASACLSEPRFLDDLCAFAYRNSDVISLDLLLIKFDLEPKTRHLAYAHYYFHARMRTKSDSVFGLLSDSDLDHAFLRQRRGVVLVMAGKVEKGELQWRRALESAERDYDFLTQSQILTAMGIKAKINLDYDVAEPLYVRAYKAASTIRNYRALVDVLGNYGSMQWRQDKYLEAAQKLDRAIEYATRLQLTKKLAPYYSTYASAMYDLGRYTDAFKAYDLAESFARETKRHTVGHTIVTNRGRAFFGLHEYRHARASYQVAYQMAVDWNLRDKKLISQVDLISTDMLLGDIPIARGREKLLDLVPLFNPAKQSVNIITIFEIVALTYLDEENYLKARHYFEKARQVASSSKRSMEMARYMSGVAHVDILEQKLDSALAKYDRAAALSGITKKSDIMSAIHTGYGDVYYALDDFNQAAWNYQTAIDYVEKGRDSLRVNELKVGYLDANIAAYQKLSESYYQRLGLANEPGRLDSLFLSMEGARGRSFQDIGSFGAVRDLAAVHPRKLRSYREACEALELAQLNARMTAHSTASEDEWEAAIAKLNVPRYSVVSQRLRFFESDSTARKSSGLDLNTIRSELTRINAALLVYQFSDRQSFVLVITPTSTEAIPLDIRPSEISKTVGDLIIPLHNIGATELQDVVYHADVAHALYQDLIAPIEAALNLPEKLLIVPDVAIANLPLEILLVGPVAQSEFTPKDEPIYAANFLQNRYQITYTPTTSLLFKDGSSSADYENMLVMANPFDNRLAMLSPEEAQSLRESAPRSGDSRAGWQFAPLPHSSVEAKNIREIHGDALVFQRSAATEQVFFDNAVNADIIHLATHGYVDTTFSDAFSGLVLAPDLSTADDGMLMGYEIADLQLNCKLVTLSACETGLGRRAHGEGVLGLPRLFLGAGSETVLMTYWKVDDYFTSQLMPDFYKRLLEDKLSRNEALAMAKRAVVNGQSVSSEGLHYQHPAFWGAFVLFGDPGEVDEGSPATYLISVLVLGLIAFATLLLRWRFRPEAEQPTADKEAIN